MSFEGSKDDATNDITLTDIEVCDNMLGKEVGKVFTILGASNEAVLEQFLKTYEEPEQEYL